MWIFDVLRIWKVHFLLEKWFPNSWLKKHSTIVIQSVVSYINKWKVISCIAINSHQYNAKELFAIIIKRSAIDWRLYSDKLVIYSSNTVGRFKISDKSLAIFFQSSVGLGGCTYCSLRQYQTVEHVLLIILLIVDLAIWNEKLRDCWLPPYPR